MDKLYELGSGQKMQITRLMATEIFPIEHCLNGGVVIDAGANVGLWSAALSLYCGDRVGSLYMFEPLPEAQTRIKRLMQFIEPTHSWYLTQSALGDVEKRAILHVEADNPVSALSTLAGDFSQLPRETRRLDEKIEVEVSTIDIFCKKHNIKNIDHIKLDVEGFEMNAMIGAQNLIKSKNVRSISFEFGLNHLNSIRFYEFWEFLTGNGYKVSLMKRGDLGFDLRRLEEYTTHLEKYDVNRYYLAELEA